MKVTVGNKSYTSLADYQYERYYKYFFPIIWKRILFRIATCDGRFALRNVEISPRYANSMMQRYLIFETSQEVTSFCYENQPHTLQFGAVMPAYNTPLGRGGRERAKLLMDAGVARGKGPFVLDIDLKDFDRKGICKCPDTGMCQTCWNTFTPSIRRVTEYFLKDVFNFKNVLPIFSGGRGIHYWVMDKRVVDFGPEERTVLFNCIAYRLQFDQHYNHIMEHFLRPAYEANGLLFNNKKQQVTDKVIFDRLYPKYDKPISVNAYHLKKMPFLMHQRTRTVCLPLPPLLFHHQWSYEKHAQCSDQLTEDDIEINIAGAEAILDEV